MLRTLTQSELGTLTQVNLSALTIEDPIVASASGGAVLGGSAVVFGSNYWRRCPCAEFSESMAGGIVATATADVALFTIGGGAVVGGSATVRIQNYLYDGLIACWPLDETGMGVEEEYKDHTRNMLHGTGGYQTVEGEIVVQSEFDAETGEIPDFNTAGVAVWGAGDPEPSEEPTDYIEFMEGGLLATGEATVLSTGLEGVPVVAGGVDCYVSQFFGGSSMIRIPADDHSGPFSVSLWFRSDHTEPQPRILFSRGHDTDNNRSVFFLGHNAFSELWAGALKEDGELIEVYGNRPLQTQRWYHLGATFDGSTLAVFVNGALECSVNCPSIEPPNNSGALGSLSYGAFALGRIQEVRLFGDVRSADWFTTERRNFCDAGLYYCGPLEVLA